MAYNGCLTRIWHQEKAIPFSMMASIAIVAYLALFATVGFLFILVSLLLGKLLRPHAPTAQKLATYECGEPSVGPGLGSGTAQFDLRFYVVALVFLIFEVEVALFFPAAIVFGKANQLRDPGRSTMCIDLKRGSDAAPSLAPETEKIYREFGVESSAVMQNAKGVHGMPASEKAVKNNTEAIKKQAKTLSLASMLDLGVFFAVLLVGFAFVWKRGDLNWVRAMRHPSTPIETAAMMSKMRREDF